VHDLRATGRGCLPSPLVALTTAAVILVIGSLSIGLMIANRERRVGESQFAQFRQLANKFIDLDNQRFARSGANEPVVSKAEDSEDR
jgi:hypothetical protein